GCTYIIPSMVTLVDLSQDELDVIMNHVPGGASNIQDMYPLAPLQEGIYFHHLMSDKTTGDPYLLSELLSFSSSKKRSEFIKALDFVIHRHDVLRTCVLNEGLPQAVQIVLREVNLTVEELSLDKEKDILSQLQQKQVSDNLYMDLANAPAIQVKVVDNVDNDVYYLVLDHHHIMMDHMGTSKIIEEIGLYLSGRAGMLPTPVLFRDFVGYVINREKIAKSETYFRGLYSRIETPSYPFNLSDTKIAGSSIIATSKKMLSSELRDCIRKVSNDLQVSPAVLFHAAFGLVVGKCSGTDYALFGSVLLGRLQGVKGSESSLGLFMNTLPIVLDLKGDIPSYISQTSESLQTLLDHEQTPLSSVHDWSGIPNDVSMFSALLNYRHSVLGYPDNVSGFEGTLVSGYAQTNYPFSFDIDDYGNDFGLTFNVSSLDMDPSTVISYMEEALKELLLHMSKESLMTVESLSILTEAESHQLLEVFNDTDMDYPKDSTVVELFEAQVLKTPDTIAVVYGSESLSYRELEERSNQLAHYLIDKGVSVEDRVGICMDRSLEMIVSILGVLKSGAAYVPIDPDYPKDRINFMIQDATIDLLLSTSGLVDRMSDLEVSELILLDKDWELIQKQFIRSPAIEVSVNNLAYVIYTSGSTGTPKGVQIEHKNIVSLAKSCDYVTLNEETVWLSTGSISFDATTIEYWGTLLNGGRLLLTTIDTLLNTLRLKTVLLENKVTTLWMTASWFHQVVEEDISAFSSLSYLLVGGDTVLFNYTNKIKEAYPELTIINGYGPTENTTFSTTYTIEKTAGALPIGKPIKNSSAYITDTQLNVLPVGAIGELVVGGSGVARGYLNNEKLTHERFVANPFKDGGRLYKTGDLAKWLPDGNIAFIGRKDDQVKIRGYRIELGEIENALSSISEVIQCCVLAKTDDHGDKRLLAYVVMENALDKEVLQWQLESHLPEYMVPRLWVELDEMPLTSNRKLDRKALPEIDLSTLSTKTYAAPRTEIEAQLAEIWQELLGVEQIGIHDNFFELGGHSLLAVRLIARIRKLGYTMSIGGFYADPNIAQLSEKLMASDEAYTLPDNGIVQGSAYIIPSMVTLMDLTQEELDVIMNHVPGGASNIQDIYPLAPLQQGIYFHHLMSDKSIGDPYILSELLSFSSLDKRSEFIEALGFVINRHDVLRTCVLNEGLPQAVQVVLRAVELNVEELSLDKEVDILFQVKKEQASENLYIDLTKAPAMQVKVADDVDNGVYYLLLDHHHIMMDHMGTSKIIEEIELYLVGRASQLPTPALYREFVGQIINKEKTGENKKYFSDVYSDIDTPSYPFNLSDTKIDGSSTIMTSKKILSSELRDHIRKVSNDLKISPAVLFHAAFGLVVGRCSGTDYALFGSVLLGRLQGIKGSESSLGLFMNTLPVLLDVKGDIPSYISQTDAYLQTLLNHEQTPLSSVHQWSGIPNDIPMFSALLNYKHSTKEATEEASGFEGTFLSGYARTNYPFGFDVEDYGNDFKLTSNISSLDIDPSAVVSYMEEVLKELLVHIDEESYVTVESISILSEEEVHQLLEVFNDIAVSYPKDKTVVDLFEAQVLETPDAAAVVYDAENLTYKELDEKSNQLANYLIEKGVSSEHLIGICLDRSLEMIISIF
ncbi:non-ribosomal peptide synthetase, partial [Tenacibaculum piscium]|uniref:non-ribosomal peptide synthetase n=1 Tax=Tenacibaculum piscium TaxID=1458515 RepID=UPI001F33B9CD